MASQHRIDAAFDWNPPASGAAIRQAEADYGGPLSAEYVDLIRLHNGGSTRGNLSILDVEDAVQRNVDYEVAQYMPGYFMIGDDGGGSAVLLNLRDRRVYEVDMGVMDERFAELSANSLAELIELGSSLSERSDEP